MLKSHPRTLLTSIFTALTVFLIGLPSARAYEACTSKNDYLEKQLESAMKTLKGNLVGFDGAPIRAKDPSVFPCESCEPEVQIPFRYSDVSILTPKPLLPNAAEKACVEAAQTDYPVERFVHCESTSDSIAEGKRFKIREKPCISKNYVDSAAILLKTVSMCAGVSSHELFSLWNHESGLHPNIVSETGAGGATQLTSGAIRFVRTLDMYDGEFNDQGLTAKMLNLGRDTVRKFTTRLQVDPRCTNLASLANYTPKDAEKSCELLSTPYLPAAAYIIGAKNYLVGKQILEVSVKELFSSLKPLNLSAQDIPYLNTTLAQYAYNGGIPGIMTAFESFFLLNSYESPLKKTKIIPRNLARADFLKEFSEFLKKNYGTRNNPGRRDEVGTYLFDPVKKNGILDMVEKVEKKVGHPCFR
jgi:hypothetical protein